MKSLPTILTVLFLLVFFAESGFSQKKVDEVYYFYELDTYYITIKKINNLKPKHRGRSDIQLMLADCYWNIGEKERGRQLYEDIAIYAEIPTSFRDKYEEAIREKPAAEASEATLIADHAIEQQVEKDPQPEMSSEPALEQEESFAMVGGMIPMSSTISSPAKTVESLSRVVGREALVVEEKPEEMETIVLEEKKEVAVMEWKEEEKPVSNGLMQALGDESSGKYRVRVGTFKDMQEFDLLGPEVLATAEIQEWAGKKIVFIGFYASSEMAQSFIDQYLKEDYENAVVVVKKDGRYRSVR